MGLFKATTADLQKKSAGIIDVFTKTVDDLKSVNEEIQKQHDDHLAQIEEHNRHVSTLRDLQDSNNKVIDKITQFLTS